MQQLFTTPTRIASEDVVVLKPEQLAMYQQCCGCGLVHKIEVSDRAEDLRFRFVNVGHQFPSDFDVQTYLERS